MSKELIKTEKNEIQTTTFLSDIISDAEKGNGFENMGANDIAIPFLTILQALSPQIRGTGKIPGAQEGSIYNSVTESIYTGEVRVIPCAYSKMYVEWVPRENGGGFVAQHSDPKILEQTTRDDKNNAILKNGNIISETAYHYVLVLKENKEFEKALIGMSRSQLKKSRRWNSQMMSMLIDINGKKITPPTFAYTYSLETEEQTKDDYTWMNWKIGDPKIITDVDLYKMAKKFHNDVTSGLIKAATPPEDEFSASSSVVEDNIL